MRRTLLLVTALLVGCPTELPLPDPSAPTLGLAVVRYRAESRDENESLVLRGVLSPDPAVSSVLDPIEALAASGAIVDRLDGAFVLADVGPSFALVPETPLEGGLSAGGGGELLALGEVVQAYLESVDTFSFYRSSPEDEIDFAALTGALPFAFDGGPTLASLALPSAPESLDWGPLTTGTLSPLGEISWTPSGIEGAEMLIEVALENGERLRARVPEEDGLAVLSEELLLGLEGDLVVTLTRMERRFLPLSLGRLELRLLADSRFSVRPPDRPRSLDEGGALATMEVEPAVVGVGTSATLTLSSVPGTFPEEGLAFEPLEGLTLGAPTVESGGAVARVAVAVSPFVTPRRVALRAVGGLRPAIVSLAGIVPPMIECEQALASAALGDGDHWMRELVPAGSLDVSCAGSTFTGPVRYFRLPVAVGAQLFVDALAESGEIAMVAWDGCSGAELACTADGWWGASLNVSGDAGAIVAVAFRTIEDAGDVDLAVVEALNVEVLATPARVTAGQITEVRLASSVYPWTEALLPELDFGEEITVLSVTSSVVSEVAVTIDVAANAALGPRDLFVETDGESAVAVDGLVVDARGEPSDVCLSVGALPVLGEGGTTGDLNALTDSGELGCGGSTLGGPDGSFVIEPPLGGGDVLVSFQSDFDAELSLAEQCGSTPLQCVDEAGDTDVETMLIPAAAFGAGPLVLGIDGRGPGAYLVTVQVLP